MGILRIYLALVVLLHHCPGGSIIHKFSHPALAVQCFYAVSGFYMQLLINEFNKNQTLWVRDFYFNRFLRLFPTYFFILVITIVFVPDSLKDLNSGSFKEAAFFWFNNLFIITQSPVRFFNLQITILKQSWTLSLEMMFYILVPYLLLQSNRTLLLVVTASIVCRFMLCDYDLYLHNWLYEFFPNELGIFVSGSLAYRFYKYYLTAGHPLKQKLTKIFSFFVFCFLCYFCCYGWLYIEGGQWDGKSALGVPLRYWAVLIVTIVSLPFIFHLTGKLKIDRYIGELSYPVYLSHFFFIDLIKKYVASQYQNIVVLLLTILLSIFIMHIIEKPFSTFRQKLKQKTDTTKPKEVRVELATELI